MTKVREKFEKIDLLWHLNYADEAKKTGYYIQRAALSFAKTEEFQLKSRREKDKIVLMLADLIDFLEYAEIICKADMKEGGKR